MKYLGVVLFVSSALCANAQATSTGGMNNGRTWNAMSPDMRLAYVSAVRDVLVYASVADKDGFTKDFITPNGFTTADLVKAITQFYDSPENIMIGILYAHRICVLKFKGAPPGLIEEVTAAVRKASTPN